MSQRRQRYSIAQHIEDGGGTPVPYDEGIASGRDLGKRPDALRALDAVDAGELDGLAWETLDRVTRDEHGTDAGLIAETLGRRRALLVTLERDYRLWRRTDLRDYKRETAESGDELLKIRDRLWGGVLEKAKDEPFFMGVPPYGYTTTLERRPGTGKRGGTDVKRIPAKDARCTEAMMAVKHQMDACTALGEVAYRLNAAGVFRQAVAGELAGAPMRWRTEDLRRILDKPIYGGWWTLGRDSDGSSSIWEHSPTGANHGGRIPALHVPDLAWFSDEQLDVWRAKYPASADRSGPRHRKESYPLRNMLWCASCGRVLVGYRKGLYTCPERNTKKMDKLCDAPQFLTERGAVKAMLAELPHALACVKHRREELAVAAADSDELDALRRRRDVRIRQCEAMAAQWYGDDSDGTVPEPIAIRLKTWKAEADALTAQIAEREQYLSSQAANGDLVDAVLADPDGLVTKLPERERIAALRLIFARVRIEADGWGSGRTYKMAAYQNLLLDSELQPGSAGAPSVYHTIAFWLGWRQ